MIALQTPVHPGEVLRAITAATPALTSEYRVAAAYVTFDGAKLMNAELSSTVTNWSTIPKTLITCFDFGTTDPSALEFLQAQGFDVRIANLESEEAGSLSASSSSYHPKVYAATAANVVHVVVGSANLTRRALTVNTEAVTTTPEAEADFATNWKHLVENSVPLTQTLLDDYRAKRPKRRAPVPDEPRVPLPLPAPKTLPVFRDEVEAGQLRPEDYQAFWIQLGGPSGGSGNQLELPRRGNRFFGFDFDDYDLTSVIEIGEPELRNAGRHWNDRKLTWHGDNRMERFNLPTTAMSGLSYSHQVILFHRSGAVFELSVAAPTSTEAEAWKNESAASNLLFRFGPNSPRLCGLF